jgi:2'-5' RNA ligase
MGTIRAFIAVDIGEGIRRELDELQRKLKKVHANVRWVKPRNIHLTLAFLGELPPEKIDAVKQGLDRACEQLAAFEIEACGFGFFGRRSHPRVIWAGVSDCPPLTELQGRIVQNLNDAGIEFDKKPFTPHLTLGRVRGIDRHIEPLLEKIGKYSELCLGLNHIDRVELLQSRLTPAGAEYAVLHRALLKSQPGYDKAGK